MLTSFNKNHMHRFLDFSFTCKYSFASLILGLDQVGTGFKIEYYDHGYGPI